jgi:hypothetical protein
VSLRSVLRDVSLLKVLRTVEGAEVRGVVGLRAREAVARGELDVQVALVLVLEGEGCECFVEDDVNLAERRLVRDLRLVGVEDDVTDDLREELRLDHVVTASLVGLVAFAYGLCLDCVEAGFGRKAGDLGGFRVLVDVDSAVVLLAVDVEMGDLEESSALTNSLMDVRDVLSHRRHS